jgi:hypothetical protein
MWRGPRAAKMVGGNGGGNGGRSRGWTRQWLPLSEHAQRCLDASVRTVGLTGAPHVVLIFFQFIQNRLNFKKLEMGALSYLKNSQFLHDARLGKYEQFFQLCRHPIPNINRAKNPGSDSTFESLMNFKRGLNLLEKSGKFPKILS